MISFFYETSFGIENASSWKNKISVVCREEGYSIEALNYIFCDDHYLLQINKEYLQHDYFTDVIGFQYSSGLALEGDIYISIERVKENAEENGVDFEIEMARVMIHGVLHFMGYEDKTKEKAMLMRLAEDKYLAEFCK